MICFTHTFVRQMREIYNIKAMGVSPCGFVLGFMGFVCDDLRSVQPPEAQSLRLIHAAGLIFSPFLPFHSFVRGNIQINKRCSTKLETYPTTFAVQFLTCTRDQRAPDRSSDV